MLDISQLVKDSTNNIAYFKGDPFAFAIQPMVATLGGARKSGPEGHAIVVEGDLPLLFTCPHGGYRNDASPYKPRGAGGIDTRAKEFTLALAYLMQRYYGRKPSVLINELDRKYIELNRSPEEIPPPYCDDRLGPYYRFYHETIRTVMRSMIASNGSGLHMSWHTWGHKASSSYKLRDLFANKNNPKPCDKPDEEIAPLPIEVQPQINFALIMGTRLKTTIDPRRGIDVVIGDSYWDYCEDELRRGIPVFVPTKKDRYALLGGAHEITHSLEFASDQSHPVDSVQIEVNHATLRHSLEHLLLLSLFAMRNALQAYGVKLTPR